MARKLFPMGKENESMRVIVRQFGDRPTHHEVKT